MERTVPTIGEAGREVAAGVVLLPEGREITYRHVAPGDAPALPENARMLKLLRDLGLPERHGFVDNIERVELTLGSPADSSRCGLRDPTAIEFRTVFSPTAEQPRPRAPSYSHDAISLPSSCASKGGQTVALRCVCRQFRRGVNRHRENSPDFPPLFWSSWIDSIVIARSTAFTMS